MPELNWIGKQKIKNHHNEMPFHLLKKKYTYKSENVHHENSEDNILIQGDNLLALKSLLPKYEGKIDCIYIDPPYNTGNTPDNGGWIYNDNVSDPRIEKWLGEVVGKEGEDLTRHDKWLCMIYPRLKLMEKLLHEDGVIFISIDDTELAHLRLVCDEIFGYQNFIECFCWEKTSTPASLSKTSRSNLDYILTYQKKNTQKIFDSHKEDKNGTDSPVENKDNPVSTIILKPGVIKCNFPDGTYNKEQYGNGKLLNDLIVKNGTNCEELIYCSNLKWGQDYLENEIKQGTELLFKSTKMSLRYKKKEERKKIMSPNKLIDSKFGVGTNDNAKSDLDELGITFSYSKPYSLVSFLINLINNKDMIVLDGFMGSGTTAHAILHLNNKDKGNRKFIGIEMMDYAENITAERIRKVINGYGSKPETQQGTGGGFSFYTIGETLFDKEGNLNNRADLQSIREYIAHSEKIEVIFNQEISGYFLGKNYQTAYIFYYEANQITTLSLEFLRHLNADFLSEKPQDYIIYADKCTLSDEQLAQFKIRFKRIPRDIRKL
jgi:adenine specific DNA methylase